MPDKDKAKDVPTKEIAAVTPKKRYNSTNLSLAQIGQIANALGNSGMFPDVTDGQKAFVKILAGQEFGISPFAAMTGIHIIKGKASIGANLMAAQVKAKGKYDYEVVKHDDKECIIDFYEVTKTGRKLLGNSAFTIAEAEKAGLTKPSKNGEPSNWVKWPKNMVFARAMSNGVKWYTPDVFGSPVYTPDELADGAVPVEIIDGTPPDGSVPADIQEPAEAEFVDDEPNEQDTPEPEQKPAETTQATPADSSRLAGQMYRAKIFALLRGHGFEGPIAKQIIYEACGIKSITNDLTVTKAKTLIELLEKTSRVKLDKFIERTGIRDKVAAGLAPVDKTDEKTDDMTQAALDTIGGTVVDEGDGLGDVSLEDTPFDNEANNKKGIS